MSASANLAAIHRPVTACVQPGRVGRVRGPYCLSLRSSTIPESTLAPFKMPGATIVHAAAFAVGALVGGGAMAAVSARRQQQAPPASVPAVAPTPPQPVVDVKPGGVTRISPQAASPVSVLPPMLKYGNPGTWLVCFDVMKVETHLWVLYS